jgi:hypothetical protein
VRLGEQVRLERGQPAARGVGRVEAVEPAGDAQAHELLLIAAEAGQRAPGLGGTGLTLSLGRAPWGQKPRFALRSIGTIGR